jgi:hypothetical protein
MKQINQNVFGSQVRTAGCEPSKFSAYQTAMAVSQPFPSVTIVAHDSLAHFLDRNWLACTYARCRVEISMRCDDFVPR